MNVKLKVPWSGIGPYERVTEQLGCHRPWQEALLVPAVYQDMQGCSPRWRGKNWAANACSVQDTCIYLSRIDTCAVQIPGKEAQEMPCIILHQDVAGVWDPQVIICPNLRVFVCSAFFKKKWVPHDLGPNIHPQWLLVYCPSFGKSDAF